VERFPDGIVRSIFNPPKHVATSQVEFRVSSFCLLLFWGCTFKLDSFTDGFAYRGSLRKFLNDQSSLTEATFEGNFEPLSSFDETCLSRLRPDFPSSVYSLLVGFVRLVTVTLLTLSEKTLTSISSPSLYGCQFGSEVKAANNSTIHSPTYDIFCSIFILNKMEVYAYI
jgi:hypothetical protein